ncbi:MAG: 16S rRNA (guanine(527)-N(7))-methyltransferase RsmG [Oscillospiraceae bacterium]|nr:16S rRNA (guanine(527)-N(7))-methyltransferase RsmG [Oscillospiraceae bacterium]
MSIEILKECFEESGVFLNKIQINKFYDYAMILIEWNKKVNLTSIVDFRDIIVKHFLDSIIIDKFIDFKGSKKLIDIGSGAGFPSIPLKIVYNNLDITMLDCLNKRILFLKEALDIIKIKGEIIHGRAEEVSHKQEYREQYDISVARAVSNISNLVEFCLPYTKIGGYFLALKGGDILEEVEKSKGAIDILGGKIEKIYEYDLNKDYKRSLVVIKKVSQTNTIYPRKYSKILKKSL